MQHTNPDLLTPSADQRAQSVPKAVALTAPIKTYQLPEARYFVCTVHSASFHRVDGKKIPFVRGMCKTDIAADVEYLEEQMAHGNPYLRYATEEEVAHIKMLLDPRGTIKEQVRPEIESELRAELEAKIRKEIADAAKIAGVDGAVNQKPGDVRARVNAIHSGATKEGAAVVAPVNQFKPVSTADVAPAAKASGV